MASGTTASISSIRKNQNHHQHHHPHLIQLNNNNNNNNNRRNESTTTHSRQTSFELNNLIQPKNTTTTTIDNNNNNNNNNNSFAIKSNQHSSDSNHQQQYNHHRRNSSMTSNGSSIAPRTASSTSLVQLSNAPTPDGLPSSTLKPLPENGDSQDSSLSPLTTIANKLPYLTESQQEPIRRTLELINLSSTKSPEQKEPIQPTPPLLLAHSWTLFFSDTSVSKSSSVRGHHHSHSQRDHTSLLKAAEYQSGMSQVFTGIGDVESLCACLAGFKHTIAEGIRKGNLIGPPPSTPHTAGTSSPGFRRSFASTELPGTPDNTPTGPLEDTLVVPGNGLGLIAMKPGHNLHFFRVGVNPVWEDPWNAKGGRLTIQTPLAALDPTFESIVLLIAGGVLETDANRKLSGNSGSAGHDESKPLKQGGRVVGVVGSRRRNGDRIEIWLAGPHIGAPPSEEWIRNIQIVLALEIGSPEIRSTRYKKHLM
ncbi:hypothetical protein PGTUg99_015027 [Puccinia graminis f. sp. tritici]|uniref:Uncharacterized protein n=1 Tax=Puccinia graminis f. sp. tritici TaxID=56615 RepID=A0A5B0R8R1_PUCGR|nr:hypothetical protein PGTUg99_015027 [Puccinia graminis f. sp. tritici]